MSNTIKLKNYLNVFEEYAAAAAITPGHLIYLNSSGTVAVHADENGNVLPMFAIEDELQGKDIDDAYVAGDRVQCWIPSRGDQVNAILKDEETIVIGDFVVSGGDGTVKKYDAMTSNLDLEHPVGVALAALDLSSSSATSVANTRLAIRII